MKQEVGVGSRTPESSGVVATSIEFMLRAALRDYVDADFVHPIVGKIIAEVTDFGEQEAGCLQASLVQFDMALDHGIDTGRLGDGISGDISEYWERLFDVETGCLKEEIQSEYEVLSMDLLIIEHLELYPRFRGLGIGVSAVRRTIDVFGTGCGLVVCKPWPFQFTPTAAADQVALKRLELPNIEEGVALQKLRKYVSHMGFWPLADTGIYLMSLSQRGCEHSRQSKIH
jgi:hypothetical protein